MNKAIPYVIVLIGTLFILRGLALGIPFLSPPAEKLTPAIHRNDMKQGKPTEAIKHACCNPDTMQIAK